ncbi:MAG: hypothetical protein U0796_09815 [Gemmatales bacterium]
MPRLFDRFVASNIKPRQLKPVLEILEDRCVLDAWGLNLDFGTSASGVGQGYLSVPVQKFDPITGYGWTDVSAISAVNRPDAKTSTLDRAFHTGQRGTFQIAVPNGDYQVTLRFGDPSGSTGPMFGILENRLIFSNTSTAPGQIIEKTYKVKVTDQQLSLLLTSRKSSSSGFALNSMKIFSNNVVKPSNIALQGTSILENRPAGTVVGTLSTTYPNAAGNRNSRTTSTFTLVSGDGSTDNKMFSIVGNKLVTNSILDYEAQATRTVRIKSIVAAGLSFEKVFTINVQNVNEAPTALSLSNSVLQKQPAAGTLVGLLTTTDPDRGDSFTYSLVTGMGSRNNDQFVVKDGSLITGATLAAGSYSIRLRSTDAGGLFTEQAVVITVNDSNQAPTNITLTGSSILENNPVGTLVGSLSTTDPNTGDTFTYSLVNGTGSNDNSVFAISGNQLITNSILNYEAQPTRTVRIRTTDAVGLSFDKIFTITVQNVNEAPTAILLSNNSIPQNMPAGTLVGQLSTTDPDQGDSFTYSLVSGTGSTNNVGFIIQGSSLKTNAALAVGTYSIRVRSADAGGLFSERVLVITVSGMTSNLLVNKTNLQYVGAFRVPPYYDNIDEFSYGGTAIAFNPTNNSLFLVGHYQAVTEISIPSTIVNSSNLGSLTTASMLQPWSQVLQRLPNQLTGASDGAPIGGLIVNDGKLIGTQYAYYSGAPSQITSHFVIDSLNLDTANIRGLYQVGNLSRTVAGFMTPVPAEWQSVLGAPFLTGQADIPIISTTSSGPAAFGFDPNQLTGPETNIIPATPYLYYPVGMPLGAYVGPANPLQSGTTSINGMVFVPGSRSVLFFGKTGTNYTGYGDDFEWGDINDFGKGPHSLNGEYTYQVWAYDVNDFVAVKLGLKQPWELQPYNTWNFDFPISGGNKQIGGVAFDPSSGRIYISSMNQDREVPYSSLPLVQVFQINLTPPTSPLTPQIGTLAVTPTNLQPGAVQIGTQLTLTAGNVYAIQPGHSITQVAFYLDSNNDGILQQGSDQLLGYGSQLSSNHTSTVQISTSSLSSGRQTVFAQVLDSGNLLGDTIATSFMLF